MDILFATPNFGSKLVGTQTPLAVGLSRRGHRVNGVQYLDRETVDFFPVKILPVSHPPVPHWIGQWIKYRIFRRKLMDRLKTGQPDVVVADRMAATPAIQAGLEVDVPVVGLFQGWGFARYNPWNHDADKTPKFSDLPWTAQVQYPFVKSLFHQQKAAILNAANVVVNSNFLRSTFKETFGREPDSIRTPVPLNSVTADEHDPQYLTLVNPRTELKGSGVFLKLAHHLNNRDFLVAGTLPSKQEVKQVEAMDNVTYAGWVDDMRSIYSVTQIVLAPSLVEEGGGPTVVLEGFANGIPAVGTNRGGIPEHIDGAGEVVDDPYDISQWVDAIERVLADYEEYSRKAEANAKEYDMERQTERFEQILQRSTVRN